MGIGCLMAEVIKFTGITVLPETAESSLEKAKAWGLERVVICGLTESGEFVIGGSHSEVAETILILELGKKRFLEMAEDQT